MRKLAIAVIGVVFASLTAQAQTAQKVPSQWYQQRADELTKAYDLIQKAEACDIVNKYHVFFYVDYSGCVAPKLNQAATLLSAASWQSPRMASAKDAILTVGNIPYTNTLKPKSWIDFTLETSKKEIELTSVQFGVLATKTSVEERIQLTKDQITALYNAVDAKIKGVSNKAEAAYNAAVEFMQSLTKK